MRHLLRPVAVLATSAVIATTLATSAQAAAQPDDLAGGWLKRQLTDGLIVGQYEDTFTDPDNPTWVKYNDYGLSADVAFGLAAIGGSARKVSAISDAVAPHVNSWTTGADFGAPDDVYAGSVAKAAVLAQTAGDDASSYGGVDLIERLESTVSEEVLTRGRIEDQGSFDFANTIGQSFASLALAEENSPKASAVLDFLLQQQCADGYFRLNFASSDSADQTCDGGTAEQSAPDTDATALTVLQLQSLPRPNPATAAAISSAIGWLKATQKDNGSFGGGPSTKRSNANSTGLAAWALGEQGACKVARQAATWVQRLQVTGKVKGTPFAGEKGAIAYDRAAFKAGKTQGIKRPTRDQWRRTSSQAAPGLSFVTGC